MLNSRILIVTNDETVAHHLSERLIKLGYKVVGIKTSNQEIIATIESVKPDLILTDIRLNGPREGIKTGQLIHSNFDTPIIYIAGSLGEATIQRARSSGPSGYIFKPFDEKQIYATIETALLRHDLESELREGRRWLNAVLNGINDGVIALDNQGIIRFINPIATHLMEWNEIEAIGKSLYEVFALLDEASHERIELINAKKSLNQKNGNSRFEGLLISKHGKTTLIEADVTVIQDGKRAMAGMVVVFRDITKQRDALQEIQRQRQRAEALVHTAARLNTQLELTSVLDTVCNIGNQALNASATIVFLRDDYQDIFHNHAAYTKLDRLEKFTRMKLEISGSTFESILSEKKTVVLIRDVTSNTNLPYLELFKEQNIQTMVMAGLYRQQDLIGVLMSVYLEDQMHLAEDTLTIIKGLADQAAISITNASLFDQVRRGRENQKVLTTRLVEIQESERHHIARDLHDQIGQVLTGLQFMLQSSKNQAAEGYLNKLNEAQETVSLLIEQIREMSLNLRPAMLDDIGLLHTLLWHFERYTKQTGIRVSFNHNGLSERFLPDVEITVYRIVQEALTNVARYAKVNEVFVNLALRENILEVEITDHGLGFDSNVDVSKWSTAGLAGMRERANILGGYLVVKSAPNIGTQIQALLPLDLKPVDRRNRDRNNHIG